MSGLATVTADQAVLMERAFLSGLNDAQDAYEQIVATQAWTALGFDSFAAWWDDRVRPAMRALSMRPTREIAAAVIEQVRAEEAALPSTWRRTQQELADMVGVERSSLATRDGSRSPQREESHRDDLEEPTLPEMPARQEVADTVLAGIDDYVSADADDRPKPPAWDPAERAQHQADVNRNLAVEAGRRTAKTIVHTVLCEVTAIVTACRYGEGDLVTADMVAELRKAIDLLEGEL